MSQPRILHMFSPGENVSPFDVNMAADAGYEIILPYRGVTESTISALVQDAIFSRPPGRHACTGGFIGGYDVNQAAEMLARAKAALVPPFEISLLADPNGAYTTAAALVARVGKALEAAGRDGFSDVEAAVLGGGPVGLCAAVLIARLGGRPRLVRLTTSSRQAAVDSFSSRYGVDLPSVAGQDDELKARALANVQVAITTAKAGIRVLDRAMLDRCGDLAVVADVNAVPPTGIEGVEPTRDGTPIATVHGEVAAFGALAVGRLKYDVQQGLLKQMLNSERALCLDFPDAYELAQQLV